MDKDLMVTLLKMVVSLGVVLGLFGAAVFAFRKFSGTSKGFLKKGSGFSAKPMEVLAFQSLGPGRNLYLVRCLDKKILVGATNTQITHLSDITEEDDEESNRFDPMLDSKSNDSNDQSFKKQMSASLREISRV